MNYPVIYLQRSDFDYNGNLINPLLKNKKILIMTQADYCGHCTEAKPDFEKAAQYMRNVSNKILFATIHADSKNPSEKDTMKIINKINPNFMGFPDYVVFVNGKRRNDDGPKGRTSKHLIEYLNQ
jgi:thiol-disulfide isomerase/thioredoxin